MAFISNGSNSYFPKLKLSQALKKEKKKALIVEKYRILSCFKFEKDKYNTKNGI